MHLSVVAEGVETKTYSWIVWVKPDVSMYRRYYFARPMPEGRV